MLRKKGSDIQRKKPNGRKDITKRKNQNGCDASCLMPTARYWHQLGDKGLTVFIIDPRLTLIIPLVAIIRIGNSMNSVVPQGAWPAPPIPPAAEPKRRIRLHSMIDCRTEMVRLYKEMRNGRLKVEDGSRLVHVLGMISRSFQDTDLEARLTALEQSE